MTDSTNQSDAATEGWIAVGALSDIPSQGARCVTQGDMTIAIFRTTDDQVFALEDKCPHKDGPLSQGIVHGDCVSCPLHNWVIDLATGQAQGADEGETRAFPVRLDGDTVYLATTHSP
jgi:nitrite reductase (NADH) small subunit